MKIYKFNNEGSTLLMVIIMSAVLTVLGVAVLSMTMMNIHMKYTNYQVKTNAYYAESGIDELYAYVSKKVIGALEFSLNQTKTDLNTLVIDDVTGKSYFNGINYQVYLDQPASDPTITIEQKQFDPDVIKALANQIFRYHFIEQLNLDLTSVDLNAQILTATDVITGAQDIQLNTSVITIGSVTNFDSVVGIEISGKKFEINGITSTFSTASEPNIEKVVTTDIVINSDLVYPFEINENDILLTNNPIWQNALVADNNITFANCTATFDGDVYATGLYEEKSNPLGSSLPDVRNYINNGIKVDAGADVLVNGDIVTECYVQTSGVGARLTVSKGLIYCNTLATNKGATASSITIENGNVYTLDDLELNAEESDIEIKGNYYGLSKGTSGLHNSSSAIVLNASLKSSANPNGATLIIDSLDNSTGTPIPYSIEDEKVRADLDPNNGTWIPGTTFVEIFPTDNSFFDNDIYKYFPYQTGESVAVLGNYLNYNSRLTISSGADAIYDSTNISWMSETFPAITFPTYVLPHPFEYSDFALGFKQTGGVPGNRFSQFESERYMQLAYDTLYSTNPDIFYLGTNSAIQIDNYQYVLGTYLMPGSGETNILTSTTNASDSFVYDSFIYYTLHDFYASILNTTKDKTALTRSDADNSVFDIATFDIVAHKTNLGLYNSLKVNLPLKDVNFVVNSSIPAKEVVCIYGNTQNIYIQGTGGNTGPDPTNIMDDNTDVNATGGYLQGVIITQGNVYISGNVEFAGTIISGGDIEVGDSSLGSASIVNFYNKDEKIKKYLAELIAVTDLKPLFDGGGFAYVSNPTISLSGADLVLTNEYADLNMRYSELIDFRHWKLD